MLLILIFLVIGLADAFSDKIKAGTMVSRADREE